MDEYINREDAIAKLTDLDAIEPNATMVDVKRLLTVMPAAKTVSLHDIYRVIAGHSYYHGDRILAALSCIAEGKEVNPVRPADVPPVVHGYWEHKITNDGENIGICHNCKYPVSWFWEQAKYCPNCGAKMDGGADHAPD